MWRPIHAWRARKQPLGRVPALRAALAIGGMLSLIHLALLIPLGLGEPGFVSTLMFQAAAEPVTAALVFWTGLWLMRAHRGLGTALCALAAVYVVMGLGLWLAGSMGAILSLGVAWFGGPIVLGALAAAWFVTAAAALPVRKYLLVLGSSTLLGTMATLVSVYAAFLYPYQFMTDGSPWYGLSMLVVLWELLPQLLFLALALGLSFSLIPRFPERALRALLRKPGFEALTLQEDSLPVKLCYRLSCTLPAGLARAQRSDAVPLRNPVLDELLPLRSSDPRALAARLQGHEGTVLAVLHAWPESYLESGALVWQTDPETLHAKAQESSLEHVVKEAMEQTRALAALLEGANPARAEAERAAEAVRDIPPLDRTPL